MSRRCAWLLVCTLACACEAQGVEPPRPRADKRAMFGDAGLVPTREGEQARRELAIAGELERALAGLGFGAVSVDVELRESAAVIVIARTPAQSVTHPEAIVAELARAMIPELAPEHLHVWLQPAETGEPDRERPDPRLWALMLTCVAFGLSVGVLGERLRSRC